LITRAKYVVTQEISAPLPSIRISVSAAHSKREVEKGGHAIKEAFRRVFGRKK